MADIGCLFAYGEGLTDQASQAAINLGVGFCKESQEAKSRDGSASFWERVRTSDLRGIICRNLNAVSFEHLTHIVAIEVDIAIVWVA
jgi:hypothetical protein